MKIFELDKKQSHKRKATAPSVTRISRFLKETNLRLKEAEPSADDLRAKMQTLKKLLAQSNSKHDARTVQEIQKVMARLNAKAKEMGVSLSGAVSKDPNNLEPAPEYNLYQEDAVSEESSGPADVSADLAELLRHLKQSHQLLLKSTSGAQYQNFKHGIGDTMDDISNAINSIALYLKDSKR